MCSTCECLSGHSIQGPDGNSCSGQRLTVHVVKLGQVLQVCCTWHTGFGLVIVQNFCRVHVRTWHTWHLEAYAFITTVHCQEMLIAAVTGENRYYALWHWLRKSLQVEVC